MRPETICVYGYVHAKNTQNYTVYKFLREIVPYSYQYSFFRMGMPMSMPRPPPEEMPVVPTHPQKYAGFFMGVAEHP